jgi:hypothetical protein
VVDAVGHGGILLLEDVAGACHRLGAGGTTHLSRPPALPLESRSQQTVWNLTLSLALTVLSMDAKNAPPAGAARGIPDAAVCLE